VVVELWVWVRVWVHRTANEIREVGMGSGMRSLLQGGFRQVLGGITSPDEVLRVCQG
jgi:type II secretory ATPase GspE/PulE/Tfp pilus assembly ATPase PilB-like protein